MAIRHSDKYITHINKITLQPTSSRLVLTHTHNRFTALWILSRTTQLSHRHHMAILQSSALPSAVPTNHNLGFIHIYSHASIFHVILPLLEPFNYIIFSLSQLGQLVQKWQYTALTV